MQEQRALELLNLFKSSTIKLGLKYISILMQRLGNPEDKLKIIHIGGTNGKGSTTQFIRGILQEAGYKVGVFSSPELISPRENIRINHQDISKEAFLSYSSRVVQVAEEMRQEDLAPSYFEILTGMALLYFYEQEVDFVILEVGMGGRLDATNVIKKPIMSIITKVAIDHTDFLGATLSEIATEKAGIIKSHSIVVTPSQEVEVMTVLQQAGKKKGAELVVADCAELKQVTVNEKGTCFELAGEVFQIRMLGVHQAYNCMIAIKAMRKLQEAYHMPLTEPQIKQGIKQVVWEGRFEKLSEKPLVFIDGAHNVDGFMALSKTINQLPKRYTIGIIGILRDKEVEQMLPIISKQFDILLVTEPNNLRALKKEWLAEKLSAYSMKVEVMANIQEALVRALKIEKEYHGVSQIIAFGSLYMIGEIRQRYLELI